MIKCVGCKDMLPLEAFSNDSARATGKRYKCKACSALEFKNWQATPGYQKRLDKQTALRNAMKLASPRERWARAAANSSRARAKANGLAHNITWQWILQQTADTCVLLGVPLVYDNDRSVSDSPTLDRIDNNRGYVKDNVWVISMLANRIKSNATLEQIETVAANFRLMMDKNMLSAVKAKPDIREPTPPRTVVNPYAA